MADRNTDTSIIEHVMIILAISIPEKRFVRTTQYKSPPDTTAGGFRISEVNLLLNTDLN